MTNWEMAVLSFLRGKSSLDDCLTHDQRLAEKIRFAALNAEIGVIGPLRRREPHPGAIIDVFPPRPAPDFQPRGRSILAILAADTATNGFKDHLVYINGVALTPTYGLSELCTARLKCTFVHPGTVQIQAKSLLIDSLVSKTPRLTSNLIEIEAQNEQRFFFTLHRTSNGLLLQAEA